MEHLILLSTVVVVVGVLLYDRHRLQKKYRQEISGLLEGFEKERKEIRTDARKRSSAVMFGLTVEHFVPFIDEFPIPPESANFLGKPIDYVGYTSTDSKDECAVHFIEVKSGNSQLLPHQRNIKKAIQEGRVHWHEIRIDSNKEL